MNLQKIFMFYIVLFSRPAYPGTYHWAIYNDNNLRLYHIVGQQNSWSKEIKDNYKVFSSRTVVTAIKIGNIDDNIFNNYFDNEIIYNNDTCRTFIMRIYYNIFGNDNNIESYCINMANNNAPNVERGKGITINIYKS